MDSVAYEVNSLTKRSAHPVVFLFLILPFGIISGYLTVALAYLLSQAGMSVGQIAGLVAISFIPHTWKFIWAPLSDTTLTRKKWYILSSIVTGIGIFATGIIPMKSSYFGWLSFVILISNFAVTFVSMSTESLIAFSTSDEIKGRASGWFQAGNLGGVGLGGGAGLWMARSLPAVWMSGAVLGIVCILCSAALFFLSEPEASIHQFEKKFTKNIVSVARDLWSVVRSRNGYLALLLCFLPVGTGAASGLWSAVAGDWKASAGTVELVTGLFSGIISAIGCIAGGYICDRMDRKRAYALFGLIQALCVVAMAFAPHTESMFIVFTIIYAFITGLAYAGFAAFTLEAIGLGAVATKYSLFASLSNMPIAYMTLVDGWAHTQWGAKGMLDAEAFACFAGLLLFTTVIMMVRRLRTQTA